MAKNVQINGVDYANVASVKLPLTADLGTFGYFYDTDSGDAVASEILATKKAWVDGVEVTGSMPNIGQQTASINTKVGTVTPTLGYHNGTGSIGIDSGEQAKIITGNIRSGVTILGVAGKTSVVDTADATATAAAIVNGETAYVNGTKITGNIPSKSSADLTASGDTVTVPAGYYGDQAQKAISGGSVTPNLTASGSVIGDTESDYAITLTPKATVNTSGYISSISDGSDVTKYIQTESKNATPSDSEQTITPTAGKLLHSVVVAAVALSGNASASDVLSGKTYYKDSLTKQTGTLTVPTFSLAAGVLSIA